MEAGIGNINKTKKKMKKLLTIFFKKHKDKQSNKSTHYKITKTLKHPPPQNYM